MKRQGSPTKRGRTSGMIIGRERFAAISAVEGIKLTPDMNRRVAELDRKGLKAEDRIRAIVDAHRKG
jgi:hypothetical protein